MDWMEIFETMKPFIGIAMLAIAIIGGFAVAALTMVFAMDFVNIVMGHARGGFKVVFWLLVYFAGLGFAIVAVFDIDPGFLIWIYGGIFSGAVGAKVLIAATGGR